MQERPLGVTILAIFIIVFGVLNALGGLSALAAYGTGIRVMPDGQPIDPTSLLLSGIFALALGVFMVVVGIAALRLKRWAWIGLIALEALIIVQAIFTIVQGNFFGGIISLLLAGLILYYLFTPEVLVAFGRRQEERPVTM